MRQSLRDMIHLQVFPVSCYCHKRTLLVHSVCYVKLQIRMDTPSGIKDSIPAWIKFSVQAPGEIPYNGIYYDPPEEVCSSENISVMLYTDNNDIGSG